MIEIKKNGVAEIYNHRHKETSYHHVHGGKIHRIQKESFHDLKKACEKLPLKTSRGEFTEKHYNFKDKA